MNFKVKSIWQWFNQWRRRGMPFRLVVLLLIGLGPFIEWNMTDQHIPLINELVWTACRSIRYSSEPRVTSTLLRGYKADANRKLQKQLHAAVTNQKINLNATELDELHKLPSKANLTILFTAAKRHNLLVHDATLRRLNRELYALAVGTTALCYDNQWREVKSMLYQKPDLTKWATWRDKIEMFIYLFELILPLPIHLALLWGIIFFTLSFVISGGRNLRWLRNSAAIIVPVIIMGMLLISPFYQSLYYYKYSGSIRSFGQIIYVFIFAVIATIYGMRLKAKLSGSDKKSWRAVELLTATGFILIFPFGFYSKVFVNTEFGLSDELALRYLMVSSRQHVLYLKFDLFLEFVGMMVLTYAILLFNRLTDSKKIKYIHRTIAEFGCYVAWGIGIVVILNQWIIKNDDLYTLVRATLSGNHIYNSKVHVDINLALLVIAILLGFSLPYFKKLSKITLIVNSVVFITMLLIISQLCYILI